MDAMGVVKAVAKRRGIPIRQIGIRMGKVPNYVSASLNGGRVPQASTLANMLAVCDYKLCALPSESVPDDALIIDADESVIPYADAKVDALYKKRNALKAKMEKMQQAMDAIDEELKKLE